MPITEGGGDGSGGGDLCGTTFKELPSERGTMSPMPSGLTSGHIPKPEKGFQML